jgi:6-pyruvoyltetrahydropterin/6-carboxytetrahydropterin synthase
MVFELSQEFFFDAAHTLKREIETDSSLRIHGHTYHARVTLRGPADPQTGMLLDLGHLRAAVDTLKHQLDHRFLDEVAGLGEPTLENLCQFIYRQASQQLAQVSSVTVERRASGDRCVLTMG